MLMEKFVVCFVNKMVKNGVISLDNKDTYMYAFIVTAEKWITFFTLLCIGAMFKVWIYNLVFLVFFIWLRGRTGGLHANSFFKCYLLSIVMDLLVIILAPVLAFYRTTMLVAVGVSCLMIEIIGTVNHPNMDMNSNQIRKSKSMARIIVIVESIVIAIGIHIDIEELYIAYMACAIIVCAFFQCIAKIVGQEVKTHE